IFTLVTGVGIALAVSRQVLTAPYGMQEGNPIQVVPVVVRIIVAVLSGISFVGVPLLLARLRRRRTPWGPGKISWFSHGVAAWLLCVLPASLKNLLPAWRPWLEGWR
ncbi:MAG: hypothetical protein K8R46_06150, partial [Pirellulales bacterium]|nr:hypothetical protein [Pirellulales bacterium]